MSDTKEGTNRCHLLCLVSFAWSFCLLLLPSAALVVFFEIISFSCFASLGIFVSFCLLVCCLPSCGLFWLLLSLSAFLLSSFALASFWRVRTFFYATALNVPCLETDWMMLACLRDCCLFSVALSTTVLACVDACTQAGDGYRGTWPMRMLLELSALTGSIDIAAARACQTRLMPNWA